MSQVGIAESGEKVERYYVINYSCNDLLSQNDIFRRNVKGEKAKGMKGLL